jgi:osmotically-inducible protein OsmY
MSHRRNKGNQGPQIYQGEHSGQNLNWQFRDRSEGQDDYGAQKGYRQMHYPQREEDSDYSFGGEYIQDNAEFRPSSERPSFAGRGPQGYRRSDERITEDINEKLTRDHLVDATWISVETKSGDVILNGNVTDRESKRRAEEIAESCSGVKDVQNQLRIKRDNSDEKPN